MTAIKELPLWAQILISDKKTSSHDRRSPVSESGTAGEVAEIMAELDRVFLSDARPIPTLDGKRQWDVGALTLYSEA